MYNIDVQIVSIYYYQNQGRIQREPWAPAKHIISHIKIILLKRKIKCLVFFLF